MSAINRSRAHGTRFAAPELRGRSIPFDATFEGHRLTQQTMQPTLPVSDQRRHIGSSTPSTMCPRLENLLDALSEVALPR